MVLAVAEAILAMRHWRPVLRYLRTHKRFPRLAVPRTYAERMLWRKLVDHNPQFVVMCDKLDCKEHVKRTCPDLAVPATLWVGDDANDIPGELLQGDVLVKTNHAYKQNYAIRNGMVDRADLKKKTDVWLASRHGLRDHEWAYGCVKPRLFVERSIGKAEEDLLEFNIRASNGQPLLGSVIGHNKLPNQWTVYLDLRGRPTWGPSSPPDEPATELPRGLDVSEPYQQALAYASKLSRGIDYARFDFMWNGKTLYAGEITIYPSGGNKEIGHPQARRLITEGWRIESSGFLSRQPNGLSARLYAGALRRRLRQS
ncbi:MAG: ATP-grasp fold amidoligase family protein [Pseudomonadales bacterium]